MPAEAKEARGAPRPAVAAAKQDKKGDEAGEKKEEPVVNDVAALAQRRIGELDKQVRRMRQNRMNCQDSIDADREALVFIEREQASIRQRYEPLCERAEQHLEERKVVVQQIADTTGALNGFMSSVTQRARVANMQDARHRKANAITSLRAERGFSAGIGSTYQGKRSSSSSSTALTR